MIVVIYEPGVRHIASESLYLAFQSLRILPSMFRVSAEENSLAVTDRLCSTFKLRVEMDFSKRGQQAKTDKCTIGCLGERTWYTALTFKRRGSLLRLPSATSAHRSQCRPIFILRDPWFGCGRLLVGHCPTNGSGAGLLILGR